MNSMLEIAIEPVVMPESTDCSEEVFDLLVFHQDGSVSIQTNSAVYFYANVYYYAARELSRLLNGEPHDLEYGSPDRIIINPEKQHDLCIDETLLRSAIDADQVKCSWPGVIQFFKQLNKFTVHPVNIN